jgi:hypothetical protein
MNLIHTILLRPSVFLEIYEKGKRETQTVPSAAWVPRASVSVLVPSAAVVPWGPPLMGSIIPADVVAQTDR